MDIKTMKSESELWAEFWQERRGEGAAFSLGALARKASVSPAFLSKVFSGQKAMPSRLRDQFFDLLAVEPVDRARLEWSLVLDSTPEALRPRVAEFAVRDILQHGDERPKLVQDPNKWTLLSDWWNIAILELSSCEDFESDSAWIARKLGVPERKITEALRKLLMHGLLAINEEGELFKQESLLSFSPTRSREVVRRYHQQHMRNAMKQLEVRADQNSFQRRNISGVTFTIPRNRVADLVSRVNEFLGEVMHEYSADSPEEVYHLAVQAFPLSVESNEMQPEIKPNKKDEWRGASA